MKKLSMCLCTLLAVTLLGGCNGDGKPKLESSDVHRPGTQGPSLAYDPQIIELGSIAHNARITRYVELRNRGRKQLVIEKVVATCKCIETNLGKKTLAPNETTMLEVTFDAAGYSGKMEQHVWLVTNDSEAPSRDLVVRARIKVQ